LVKIKSYKQSKIYSKQVRKFKLILI